MRGYDSMCIDGQEGSIILTCSGGFLTIVVWDEQGQEAEVKLSDDDMVGLMRFLKDVV